MAVRFALLSVHAGKHRLRPSSLRRSTTLVTVLSLLITLSGALEGAAYATTNPASVSGVVQDGNGQPLPNISVSLQSTSSGAIGCNSSVTTDPTGHFSLLDVPAGSYRLSFYDGAGTYISPSYYPSTTDYSSAQTLTLSAGQYLTGLTQTLDLGGSISGTVSGPDGPLDNAFVYVTQSTSGVYGRSTSTAADGSYTIPGLTTGSVTLQFNPPYGSNLLQKSLAVSATAGQPTTGVDATLAPGGAITGTVKDGNGNGLGDITVLAFPTINSSGVIPSTVTAPSTGNYTLPGLDGNYDIEFVDQMNGDYAWQFYGGVSTMSGATAITVTAPDTHSGIDATLDPAGKIAGTVSDSRGNGLSNVHIYPASGGSGATPGTQSDSAGGYTLGGLPTGTYKLAFNDYNHGLFAYYPNTTDYSAATDVSAWIHR